MEPTEPRPDVLNTAELLALVRRIPSYTKLLYTMYRSPDVPRRQKLFLTAGLGYLVSPVDLVPGFIPVAGQLDDILVALTILRTVLRSVPESSAEAALTAAGLSTELIDEDLDAARTAAVLIARKTGRAVAGTSLAAGKLLLKAARGLAEMIRDRNPPR